MKKRNLVAFLAMGITLLLVLIVPSNILFLKLRRKYKRLTSMYSPQNDGNNEPDPYEEESLSESPDNHHDHKVIAEDDKKDFNYFANLGASNGNREIIVSENDKSKSYDFKTNILRPIRTGKSIRTKMSKLLFDPVVDDPGNDLLPFNESYINPVAKYLPRLEFEVDYIRLVDESGLIDASWTDGELIQAMQRLVDVWAQANIRLRIHKNEILQKVYLAKYRALAYWIYVDWPRGNLTESLVALKELEAKAKLEAGGVTTTITSSKKVKKSKKTEEDDDNDGGSEATSEESEKQRDFTKAYADVQERLDRRDFMRSAFGDDYLLSRLFEVAEERQGLLDWILGWPAARTPWEVSQLTTIYQSFYYFFMNGGGEPGAVRFRTGDCKTTKYIKLPQCQGKMQTMCEIRCLNFMLKPINFGTEERGMVRSYERKDFTLAQAVRLVAHEFGHSFKLPHPSLRSGQSCKYYKSWKDGELMTQIRAVAVKGGLKCRPLGYPNYAADATNIPDEAIMVARRYASKDLKQTPNVLGGKTIGLTTEQVSEECETLKKKQTRTVIFKDLPYPAQSGYIWRVRFKLSSAIKSRLVIAIVEPTEGNSEQQDKMKFKVLKVFQFKNQHDNVQIHYEHDISSDMVLQPNQYVALSIDGNDMKLVSEYLSLSQQVIQFKGIGTSQDLFVGQLKASGLSIVKNKHPKIERIMHPMDRSLNQFTPSKEINDQSSTYFISDKSIKMSKDGNGDNNIIDGEFYQGKALIFNFVHLPLSNTLPPIQ